VLNLEKQNILLVNMKLDPRFGETEYNDIINEIRKKLNLEKICSQRLIIAAYADPQIEDQLERIIQYFNLQDSSKGFCNVESKCYTASPRNQVFYHSYGELVSARVDFLLVPKSTQVTKSRINFTEPSSTGLNYFKQFALDTLWPSDRFGWESEIRLVRCYTP
jgi:hypothetical protein